MQSRVVLLLPAFLALSACSMAKTNEGIAGKEILRGWKEKAYSFEIQHPYDLDVSQRYSYDPATKTHDMWVYFSDKPHAPPPNRTNPRTEMRILDTYSTEPHLFEADICVMAGTHSSIMQVFGAAKRATTFMLDAQENGDITYYDTKADPYAVVLRHNMSNKWFNLKVAHYPEARNGIGEVKVYIDNQLVGTFEGHGGKSHYLKCGVYSRDASGRSEVLYRNVREFVR
ncbi:MAG: polysaccharide lyase family 7 protein [Phycisphaerae bacterium]